MRPVGALLAVATILAVTMAAAAVVPSGRDTVGDIATDGAEVVMGTRSVGAHTPEPADGHLGARLSSGGSGTGQAYATALRTAESVPASPVTLLADWVDRGPHQVGGRITDLARDPEAGTLFVASASGGVWRSSDGGRTLQSSWPDDLTQPVGAIAVMADGTILAGTGEANAGGGSTTFPGTGMYRSADGGQTWTGSGLADSRTIARIRAHPTDPHIAWVAAGGNLFGSGGERGIYRTDDGGRSWTLVLAGLTPTTGGADVAVDPADSDHLLAAMWDRRRTPALRRYGGPGSGLYDSRDGGLTWTPVTTGLPGFTADAGRIAVGLSPADPSIGYAVVTRGDGRADGLYRSADGGQSWSRVNDGSTYRASQFIFGWWFSKVFPAPDDADRVLIPGLSLLESRDGGQTFAIDPRVHADQHALVWDPDNPEIAWLGTDGGLYTSTHGGTSLTWTAARQQGFTQPYAVAVPDSAPDRVAAGFQDLGCMLGQPDAPWVDVGGCGDGLVVLPHPELPDQVIICGQYGRCRLTRGFGGPTELLRTPTVDRAGWGAPLVRLPGNPDHLLFGGDTLHRSVDAGQSWQRISADLTRGHSPDRDYPFGTISEILPLDPNGQDVVVGTDDGLLWRTTDGGRAWSRLIDGDRWVTGIAVAGAGTATEVLVVGTSGYFAGDGSAQVRRSTDGGLTWTDIVDGLPDAPVNDVVVAGDAVLVATDVGVFVSWDALVASAGNQPRWRRVGQGLPQAPVSDIDHRPGIGLLTVATFGRGIWQIRLPTITRYAGADRYATAAAIQQAGSAGTGTGGTVVLASGQDSPDALSAATLVARQGGWSLVLTAAEHLPSASAAALRDLQPQQLVVVGGSSAISDAVIAHATDAAGQPTVTRIRGGDRYATAAALAVHDGTTRPGSTVLLATADSHADALAGAPLGRALDAPVLLVDRDGLPDATADALIALAPSRIVALGGPAAIAAEVLAAAGRAAGGNAEVERIAGSDRFATAAAIASAVQQADGGQSPPLGSARGAAAAAPVVWLAAGNAPADALAAAALGAPILLTDQQGLPDPTVDALAGLDPSSIRVAGGQQVIGDALLDGLRHGPAPG